MGKEKLSTSLVAFTTIKYPNRKNQNQQVRSQVFLDTATNFKTLGIPFLAVTEDCSRDYIREIQLRGVQTVNQLGEGMGPARRQAMQTSIDFFPEAKHHLWLEPEKPDIPRHALRLSKLMQKEEAVLGLFNRNNMDSYPTEQKHYYLFCREVASKILGFDLDYAFGPMVLTKKTLPYFLDYKGEYGDGWESILIPRLRILESQLGVSILPCSFSNDKRMTLAEDGKPEFLLKRVRQLQNVVPSLITEWSRLRRKK